MAIQLQTELKKLKNEMLTLSSLVEQSLQKTIRAYKDSDPELAREVIYGDFEIDKKEIDVEEECLKLLNLFQPVAIDLRFIVSMMKINNDLERIGDLAVDISQRIVSLSKRNTTDAVFDLDAMLEHAQHMVKLSLDAMTQLDVDIAITVTQSDEAIDTMLAQAFKATTRGIREHPENVHSLLNCLSIANFSEQIGDHAKKIGEEIIYTVNAEIVRHRTPQATPKNS